MRGRRHRMRMLGKYAKFVTFQSQTLTPDGGGGNTVVAKDETTAWVSIEPKSSYSEFIHGQLKENTTHIMKLRYQTGFKPAWRVKYVTDEATRYFAIEGVQDHEEETRELTLMCQEQIDKED